MAISSTNTISIGHNLPSCQCSLGGDRLLPAWVANYLEHRAKGYNYSQEGLTHWGKIPFADDPVKCRFHAMLGRCENGHIFGKELGCGREWCPDCREEYEARRFARWLPKAQQIDTMGYLVITTPPNRRPRSKDELRKVRRTIIRGLKRLGFNRGLSRWHWFGDKSHNWYPHLNLLLDCGYLPKGKLDDVKAMVARAFKASMVVVNYRYSDEVGQKVHWLKYIVRATFLDRSWDERMADELYRFNNTHSWGSWKDEAVWELAEGQREVDTIAELEAGTCPVCHSKITWKGGREGLVRTDCLPAYGFVQMGAGYWMLPDVLSRDDWLEQVVGHG